MGLCSVAARVGGIAAPAVLLGAQAGVPPLLLMGGPCLAAGVATLFLPETRGAPMFGTFEEFVRHHGGR